MGDIVSVLTLVVFTTVSTLGAGAGVLVVFGGERFLL